MRFVIIGGSYSGLTAADCVFKECRDAEVVMISTSTHSYFNVAAPRVLVEIDKLPRLFYSVEEFLSNHCKNDNRYSFIQGTVTKVLVTANGIEYNDTDTNTTKTIDFDYLIVASGCSGDPFQLSASHIQTMKGLKELHLAIEASHDIAIIGAGPTGVEVAGEIGGEYGHKKNITLYGSKGRVLASFIPRLGENAEKKLNSVNVHIANNKTVISKTENVLRFNDGTSAKADLIIPTKLTPNSGFMYHIFVDSKGHLITDDYLRVTKTIWAFGDIVDKGQRNVPDMYYQQYKTLKANIKNVIQQTPNDKCLVKYTPSADNIILLISRTGGVGLFDRYMIPSFCVWWIKGRDYAIDKAPQILK